MVPVELLVVVATALLAVLSTRAGVNPAFTSAATVVVVAGFAVYHRLLVRRLRGEAATDPLSGCFNRREGLKRLQSELERASRYGRPLTLISVDVDMFKRINDTFGHPAGDAVIKAVAATLHSASRKVDSVIRAGGEEFWVLLPETPLAQASLYAERLRAKLDQRMIVGGDLIRVTASLGVAALGREESLERLISRADGALYAAKHAGRNRVYVAEPAPPAA